GTGLGLVLGVGLTLGAVQRGWLDELAGASDESLDANTRLLAEVLDKVEKNSAQPTNAKSRHKLVEDMINAGLARFDPYSRYLNAREVKELKKRTMGNYGGIGAFVHSDRKTGVITITRPITGSPAYRGGIEAGDIILKIDGKPTEGITLEDAIDQITGPKGTSVVLTVLHEGTDKPVDLKLVRDTIHI